VPGALESRRRSRSRLDAGPKQTPAVDAVIALVFRPSEAHINFEIVSMESSARVDGPAGGKNPLAMARHRQHRPRSGWARARYESSSQGRRTPRVQALAMLRIKRNAG